ncbi:MAG: DUF2232 domain-containing protein [bacterium]
MAANIMRYAASFLFIGGIFLVLDLILYFLIKGKVKWQLIIAIGILYFIALLTIFSAISHKSTGLGIVDEMKIEMVRASEITITQYSKTGTVPADAQAVRETIKSLIIRPLYGWILVSLFFLALLNYLFVREIAKKHKKIEAPMTQYRYWFGNEAIVWVFMACVGAVMFSKPIKNELVTDIALNIMVVLVNFYGLVGGAVAAYFIANIRINKILSNILILLVAGMLLFANIFVVILFYLSIMILVPLGVFDTWFNFRKIDRGGLIWK